MLNEKKIKVIVTFRFSVDENYKIVLERLKNNGIIVDRFYRDLDDIKKGEKGLSALVVCIDDFTQIHDLAHKMRIVYQENSLDSDDFVWEVQNYDAGVGNYSDFFYQHGKVEGLKYKKNNKDDDEYSRFQEEFERNIFAEQELNDCKMYINFERWG